MEQTISIQMMLRDRGPVGERLTGYRNAPCTAEYNLKIPEIAEPQLALLVEQGQVVREIFYGEGRYFVKVEVPPVLHHPQYSLPPSTNPDRSCRDLIATHFRTLVHAPSGIYKEIEEPKIVEQPTGGFSIDIDRHTENTPGRYGLRTYVNLDPARANLVQAQSPRFQILVQEGFHYDHRTDPGAIAGRLRLRLARETYNLAYLTAGLNEGPEELRRRVEQYTTYARMIDHGVMPPAGPETHPPLDLQAIEIEYRSSTSPLFKPLRSSVPAAPPREVEVSDTDPGFSL